VLRIDHLGLLDLQVPEIRRVCTRGFGSYLLKTLAPGAALAAALALLGALTVRREREPLAPAATVRAARA
jgi:hypothetical protein